MKKTKRGKRRARYGLGYNGHAKCCKCDACAKSKLDEVRAYVKAPTVRPPPSADATVLVRAYFRRQPRHLKKWPVARKLFRAYAESLT